MGSLMFDTRSSSGIPGRTWHPHFINNFHSVDMHMQCRLSSSNSPNCNYIIFTLKDRRDEVW